MSSSLRDVLRLSYLIFVKDVRQYYNKPPVITFAFLVPGALVALFAMEVAVLCPSKTIPGLISLGVMFSSMTVPQSALGADRKLGTIDRLVFAPIKPYVILLSKLYAGFLFGVVGASVSILLVLPFASVPLIHPIYVLASVVLGSMIFSLIGVLIAIMFELTESMSVSNALRFLMLFLCGVFIPVYFLPWFLQPISLSLPLTYVAELMRYGLFGMFDFIDPLTSLVVSVIYAFFLLLVTNRLLEKKLMP